VNVVKSKITYEMKYTPYQGHFADTYA